MTMRLTVTERDTFIKRALRRGLCVSKRLRGGRRTTVLVVSASSRIAPLTVAPSVNAIIKAERVATAQERGAVVQSFHARMIL